MNVIYRLSNNSVRPVLCLDDIFPGCEALLDTGAAIPVWTAERRILEELGAIRLNRFVEFSGFGGKTKGELYQITLSLGDIVFPNMPILFKEDDGIPCFFILPGTMFSKIVITIDINSKFVSLTPVNNQKCFNLILKDSGGHPYVLCS